MTKYIVCTMYLVAGLFMNVYFNKFDIASFYFGLGTGALLVLLFHKPQTKSVKR